MQIVDKKFLNIRYIMYKNCTLQWKLYLYKLIFNYHNTFHSSGYKFNFGFRKETFVFNIQLIIRAFFSTYWDGTNCYYTKNKQK